VSQAMQFLGPGKCQGWCSLAAMGAGCVCELLFITDNLSGRCLQVDLGAQRSILPAQTVDTMTGGHGPQMDAANGMAIRTYSTRYVKVYFGGWRFGWDFVMAAVYTTTGCGLPLCLQPAGRCYELSPYRCPFFRIIPLHTWGAGALCLSNTLATGDPYQRLLSEFPDLTTPTFSSAVAKHSVEHHIATVGPPVYAQHSCSQHVCGRTPDTPPAAV